MMNGPTELDVKGLEQCVFCHHKNPCEEHLSQHRVNECFLKSEAERSFARFDNLTQHIRQMHGVIGKPTTEMLGWSRLISDRQTGWQCGFCRKYLGDWDERAKHVANHFKRVRKDMSDWWTLPILPGHRISIANE